MKKLLIALLLVSASAYAFNGALVRDYVRGDTRFCEYRDGTEVRVVTQHSSSPCQSYLND